MCVYRGVGKCESEKPLKWSIKLTRREEGMRKSYLSQTWWRRANFSTQETEARGVRVQRQKFVQNRKVQAKIEKKMPSQNGLCCEIQFQKSR